MHKMEKGGNVSHKNDYGHEVDHENNYGNAPSSNPSKRGMREDGHGKEGYASGKTRHPLKFNQAAETPGK